MPIHRAFARRFPSALFMGALLSVCALGHAQQYPPQEAGFAGYSHTAWRAGQGAPGDIWDIQQDASGALWLATGSGLYRFDGQRFERRESAQGDPHPSLNMITLFADRPGSMWIGYYQAGIGHLRDGVTLKAYQRREGVPPGVVSSFARDSNGVLWAAVEEGLRRFNGRTWEPLPSTMGVPERQGHWLLNDTRGTFWALVGQQVWFIPKGGTAFVPTGIDVSLMATLAQSPSGEIWLADRRRGAMPIADARGMLPAHEREARRLPEVLASRLHFTADGVMWATLRGGGGVARVRFEAKTAVSVEKFDAALGLTSTSAVPIFEDREGSLWVGTNLGLNRFRAQRVRTLRQGPDDPYRILARNSEGALFGYGEDMVPYDLRRGTQALPKAALQAAALANPHPLWQLDWTHLAIRRGRQLETIQFPGASRGRQPEALYFPNPDEAWVCVGEDTVLHYANGQWQTLRTLDTPGCRVIAPDGAGGLIFGYASGALVRFGGRAGRASSGPTDPQVGPVTALLAHNDLLFVAGEKGLALSRHGQPFRPVNVDIGGVLQSITGIVIDAGQQLWLNGGRGLVRLDLADALASARDGRTVSPRLFDDVDGMPGVALQSGPIPTAQLAPDGLLWLATNQGLAWLDTNAPHRSAIAPVAAIGDIHFGDTHTPLRAGMQLPAGTTQLQIDFIAQSLARPERNRYRYRLSGVDADWRDAGSTPTAYYTNLGPGHYTFDVIAASEDGVWSTEPTTRTFTIEPFVTQTFWFRSLIVVAVLLLIAAAARVRARHITALVRARFEERLRERERIARDLHDTLLQGSQGLLLRLHAISVMSTLPAEAQRQLESAMQAAESSLKEGRDRVSSLRGESATGNDLAAALAEAFNALASPGDTRLRVTVEGEPPPLRAAALEEIFLIGREAIRNAMEHARAATIEVEIAYGHPFRLHVRDDGVGMEPDRVREGHWGLQGMRERATRLQGELTLWSRPGLGTEVALAVPGYRLYSGAPTRPWTRLLTFLRPRHARADQRPRR